MSISNIMRTGVSGMDVQSSRLSALSDNIANDSTVGYKRASTEFSSLVLDNHGANYSSGGVESSTRYEISSQGILSGSNSTTDLAISGDGFFLVSDPSGDIALTRAGSFVPDANGRLVNGAGLYLMGYPTGVNGVANGTGGLQQISLTDTGLTAEASTSGQFIVNLPADADVSTSLPSLNGAAPDAAGQSSLIAYDNLGGEVQLDVYFAKTAANTWEVSVFPASDAAVPGPFPYTTGPLLSQALTFDTASGALSTPADGLLSIAVPGGSTLSLDLTNSTQLRAAYSVEQANVYGFPPGDVDNMRVTDSGVIEVVSRSGNARALYEIPLADVPAPNFLLPESGTIYRPTEESGAITVARPGEGGNGRIVAGALEQSDVDIAEELTDMMTAQRSFTANSKVFQTGSELLDTIVNLKR